MEKCGLDRFQGSEGRVETSMRDAEGHVYVVKIFEIVTILECFVHKNVGERRYAKVIDC